MKNLLYRLAKQPRAVKRTLIITADFFMLPIALWLALGLRLGEWDFPTYYPAWVYLLPSLVTIPIFMQMGLYRTVIRHLEDHAMFTMVLAVTLSIGLFAGVIGLFALPIVPRGSLVMIWSLITLYTVSSRYLARAALRQLEPAPKGHRIKVAIYGAGEAGCQLAQALKGSAQYQPMFFIDDNPQLHGLAIAGLEVHSPSALPALVKRHHIRQVLLAIPSANRKRSVEIVNQLESLKIVVRALPSIGRLVGGELTAAELGEVGVDELLGREIVAPDPELLCSDIRGKRVMVTGAGGSIGSELSRQILQSCPETLVLFEISEFALYRIEQELRTLAEKQGVELIPALGTVQDRNHLEAIIRHHRIQTLYHAAAYKHVPLVEANVTEGIRNNTLGTRATAEAALAGGVESFVLISTDKAVRPTNVMGASKRMAEMILQVLAADPTCKTRFCMVRFGNVLASSGSVVPLFRKQIASGGPVTVTHPDIIRYFMTIPEAAQLVIQAGAMGQGGEVFVLDMGQPVKILDLARRMIHLSGHSVRDENSPEGEIAINFTGLRPGEKLYEELLIGTDVTPTRHPRILKAQEQYLSPSELKETLSILKNACEKYDAEAIRHLLQNSVPEYAPLMATRLCNIKDQG